MWPVPNARDFLPGAGIFSLAFCQLFGSLCLGADSFLDVLVAASSGLDHLSPSSVISHSPDLVPPILTSIIAVQISSPLKELVWKTEDCSDHGRHKAPGVKNESDHDCGLF